MNFIKRYEYMKFNGIDELNKLMNIALKLNFKPIREKLIREMNAYIANERPDICLYIANNKKVYSLSYEFCKKWKYNIITIEDLIERIKNK